MQHGDRLAPRLVGKDQNVVALRIGGPEPGDAGCPQPLLLHDAAQHRLRIGEQAARGRSVFFVIEDRRIFALELPGREERRPVDERDQLGDRIIREHAGAEEARARRLIGARPIELERVGACERKR